MKQHLGHYNFHKVSLKASVKPFLLTFCDMSRRV